MINKIALAIFKDKKVLMGRNENRDAFYFIGGSIEEGESDLDTLEREVKEELGVELDKNSVSFLNEFEAEAHGKNGVILKLRLYKGDIIGEPKPNSEIVELRFFDSNIDQKYSTPISRKILPWLKEQGYIS